MLLISFRLV